MTNRKGNRTPSSMVNITVSPPVHARIVALRDKLSDQRNRQVSTSEALEILFDRAELTETQ